jgi:hypothetical protein
LSRFERLYPDGQPFEKKYSIEKFETIERDHAKIIHESVDKHLQDIKENVGLLDAAATALIDQAIDIKEEIQEVKRKINEKSPRKTPKARAKKVNS